MSFVECFALEDMRCGREVHWHAGVWWVRTAPFYCKPVHEFQPFPAGTARPHPLKSPAGFSHQVPSVDGATRFVPWNILDGDVLRGFSMETLRSKRRNMVRKGLRDCRVGAMRPDDVTLEQMRQINISQARRHETGNDPGACLPPDYYESHAAKWRGDMLALFGHDGHEFVGAFVDDRLVGYADVVRIAETWMFGAVKSSTEHLVHRPVDALYFTILCHAAASTGCERVINGGGAGEAESLARFKAEYLFRSVEVPYHTTTILPLGLIRGAKNVLRFLRPAREVREGGGAGRNPGLSAPVPVPSQDASGTTPGS